MSSIFSRIIQGEIPCIKLAENPYAFAFMDIFPLRRGHALVVPKREADRIYDLSPEELTGLMDLAVRLSRAIEKTVPCERVGWSVIGLEVPHAHLHLVPINTANDINFAQNKLEISKEEIQEIANSIISNIEL